MPAKDERLVAADVGHSMAGAPPAVVAGKTSVQVSPWAEARGTRATNKPTSTKKLNSLFVLSFFIIFLLWVNFTILRKALLFIVCFSLCFECQELAAVQNRPFVAAFFSHSLLLSLSSKAISSQHFCSAALE
jgi:hypothetical protein